MKKIMLCLLLTFITSAVTTTLFAQNGNGEQRQQAMRSYLKDSVKLSDALTDSVTAIGREYQPQMRDIYMDQSASMGDKQTKLQSLRTSMEARYKSAGLTDDQIQKIRDYQDRMRAQMRSQMKNNQ